MFQNQPSNEKILDLSYDAYAGQNEKHLNFLYLDIFQDIEQIKKPIGPEPIQIANNGIFFNLAELEQIAAEIANNGTSFNVAEFETDNNKKEKIIGQLQKVVRLVFNVSNFSTNHISNVLLNRLCAAKSAMINFAKSNNNKFIKRLKTRQAYMGCPGFELGGNLEIKDLLPHAAEALGDPQILLKMFQTDPRSLDLISDMVITKKIEKIHEGFQEYCKMLSGQRFSNRDKGAVYVVDMLKNGPKFFPFNKSLQQGFLDQPAQFFPEERPNLIDLYYALPRTKKPDFLKLVRLNHDMTKPQISIFNMRSRIKNQINTIKNFNNMMAHEALDFLHDNSADRDENSIKKFQHYFFDLIFNLTNGETSDLTDNLNLSTAFLAKRSIFELGYMLAADIQRPMFSNCIMRLLQTYEHVFNKHLENLEHSVNFLHGEVWTKFQKLIEIMNLLYGAVIEKNPTPKNLKKFAFYQDDLEGLLDALISVIRICGNEAEFISCVNTATIKDVYPNKLNFVEELFLDSFNKIFMGANLQVNSDQQHHSELEAHQSVVARLLRGVFMAGITGPGKGKDCQNYCSILKEFKKYFEVFNNFDIVSLAIRGICDVLLSEIKKCLCSSNILKPLSKIYYSERCQPFRYAYFCWPSRDSCFAANKSKYSDYTQRVYCYKSVKHELSDLKFFYNGRSDKKTTKIINKLLSLIIFNLNIVPPKLLKIYKIPAPPKCEITNNMNSNDYSGFVEYYKLMSFFEKLKNQRSMYTGAWSKNNQSHINPSAPSSEGFKIYSDIAKKDGHVIQDLLDPDANAINFELEKLRHYGLQLPGFNQALWYGLLNLSQKGINDTVSKFVMDYLDTHTLEFFCRAYLNFSKVLNDFNSFVPKIYLKECPNETFADMVSDILKIVTRLQIRYQKFRPVRFNMRAIVNNIKNNIYDKMETLSTQPNLQKVLLFATLDPRDVRQKIRDVTAAASISCRSTYNRSKNLNLESLEYENKSQILEALISKSLEHKPKIWHLWPKHDRFTPVDKEALSGTVPKLYDRKTGQFKDGVWVYTTHWPARGESIEDCQNRPVYQTMYFELINYVTSGIQKFTGWPKRVCHMVVDYLAIPGLKPLKYVGTRHITYSFRQQIKNFGVGIPGSITGTKVFFALANSIYKYLRIKLPGTFSVIESKFIWYLDGMMSQTMTLFGIDSPNRVRCISRGQKLKFIPKFGGGLLNISESKIITHIRCLCKNVTDLEKKILNLARSEMMQLGGIGDVIKKMNDYCKTHLDTLKLSDPLELKKFKFLNGIESTQTNVAPIFKNDEPGMVTILFVKRHSKDILKSDCPDKWFLKSEFGKTHKSYDEETTRLMQQLLLKVENSEIQIPVSHKVTCDKGVDDHWYELGNLKSERFKYNTNTVTNTMLMPRLHYVGSWHSARENPIDHLKKKNKQIVKFYREFLDSESKNLKIPEHQLKNYHESIDQILKLPQFKGFEKGAPTLKSVSNKIVSREQLFREYRLKNLIHTIMDQQIETNQGKNIKSNNTGELAKLHAPGITTPLRASEIMAMPADLTKHFDLSWEIVDGELNLHPLKYYGCMRRDVPNTIRVLNQKESSIVGILKNFFIKLITEDIQKFENIPNQCLYSGMVEDCNKKILSYICPKIPKYSHHVPNLYGRAHPCMFTHNLCITGREFLGDKLWTGKFEGPKNSCLPNLMAHLHRLATSVAMKILKIGGQGEESDYFFDSNLGRQLLDYIIFLILKTSPDMRVITIIYLFAIEHPAIFGLKKSIHDLNDFKYFTERIYTPEGIVRLKKIKSTIDIRKKILEIPTKKNKSDVIFLNHYKEYPIIYFQMAAKYLVKNQKLPVENQGLPENNISIPEYLKVLSLLFTILQNYQVYRNKYMTPNVPEYVEQLILNTLN